VLTDGADEASWPAGGSASLDTNVRHVCNVSGYRSGLTPMPVTAVHRAGIGMQAPSKLCA
jgi:hypothetical protein